MRGITIGLTGGIGSGKTFVSDHFAGLGVEIIDADLIAREVTQPNQPALQQIAEHFGDSIINEQGELIRSELRKIIFNNSVEKKWLEALLHPIIRQRIIENIEKPCQSYRILSSPLLFETHQNELVDYVLTVDVSEEIQLLRASHRDNSDSKVIQSIIQSQMSRQLRFEQSDFVINNENSKEETIQSIEALHQQFLRLTTQ